MSAQDESIHDTQHGTGTSFLGSGPSSASNGIASPPLPTSSPEMFSETDFPRPIHLPSSSALAAASQTSLPSPAHPSPHHVDFRIDPLVSRSRSSSLRPTASSSSVTPTRSPQLGADGAISPRTVLSPQPQSPTPTAKSNGHVPGPSPRMSQSGFPGLVKRGSQDRRVRSDSIPATLSHGKSAPLVTGGYATTDSDSPDDDGTVRPTSARAASHASRSQLVVEDRRRRAHSLMSPVLSDRVGSEGSGSGRSRSSSRSGRHTAHDSRDRSASISNALRPPSATRLSHQRLNGRSPLSSTAPSRVPSTRLESQVESSRHPSLRLGSRSPPKPTSDLPRAREIQRLQREDGISSPEGSRKGKERAHDSHKRNVLATSLGILPRSDSGVISTDQIHEIFANSDVGKALRMGQASRPANPPVRRDRRASSSAGTKLAESPQRNGLFTVTAPPALLRDGDMRDRTASVSSSIAPPPRSSSRRQISVDDNDGTEPARLRREARRRSSTIVEPEGGHVPFTHHLPVRVDEMQESSEEGSTRTRQTYDDDRPGSSAQHTIESTPRSDASPKPAKRKGRISGLFRRNKKSSEHLPGLQGAHDARADHAKAREQYEKDRVTRRIEQERRDAELAEERRYRAFVEVSAHPAASKRATRAMSYFDSLYGEIYDSFTSPPKVNPLATIRWAARTREQDEARQRFRAEQAERDKDPTSFPSVWSNQIYRNPLDALTPHGQSKSSASTSAKDARSSLSVASPAAPSGWKYTVNDVTSYRAAEGKVNYFMPPPEHSDMNKSLESIQEHRATGISDFSPAPVSHPPEADLGSTRGPPEIEGSTRGPPEIDLGSSLGSSHKPHMNGRLTSPSMLTINDAATGSPGSSQLNLNRTSSIDTGRLSKSPSTRRGRHRTHQSMSAVQSVGNSVGHLLKGSRDKISGRQRTLPHPSALQTQWHDSGPDEPLREKQSSVHLNSPLPARHSRTPIGSIRVRQTRPATPLDATDDEHHRGWNRVGGLFLKNRFSPMVRQDDRLKPTPVDPNERRETLDAIWHREREFEIRQAQKHIATERRKEAEAKLAETISTTRARLASLTSASDQADEFVRLQLIHLDQLKQYALVSAEIDVDFADLDTIRQRDLSSRPSGQHRAGDASAPKASTPHMPPAYTMVPKPWPRRAVLDRHGNRIDPLTQVELALRDAAEEERDMRGDRFRARDTLDKMDQTLRTLKDRKDTVRDRLDLEQKELRQLDDRLRYLHAEMARPMTWYPTLWSTSRRNDTWTDNFLRYTVRPIFRVISWLISWLSALGLWGPWGGMVIVLLGFLYHVYL